MCGKMQVILMLHPIRYVHSPLGYKRLNTHFYLYMFVYTHMYLYMFVYTHVDLYVFVYTHVFLYVFV